MYDFYYGLDQYNWEMMLTMDHETGESLWSVGSCYARAGISDFTVEPLKLLGPAKSVLIREVSSFQG